MTYPLRAVVAPLERIEPKLDMTGDCWVWTGALNRYGYGHVSKGRRLGAARVHRFLWTLLVGPIDDDLDLDHLCRNRACCNPDHLDPVSRQINVDRGLQRAGRARTRRNA